MINSKNQSSKKNSLNPFLLIQILSLDVVVGALASGFMANLVFKAGLNTWWYVILALSVWIIYTTDHLLDGWRRKEFSSSLRHYYHYKYRKAFIIAILIALLVNLFLVFTKLHIQIIYFGIILGSIAAIYLYSIYKWGHTQKLLLQKEAMIAVIYTIGIFGSPFLMKSFILSHFSFIDWSHIVVFVSFLILAWINTVSLAVYEMHADKQDQSISFPLKYKKSTTKKLCNTLLILVFIANAIAILYVPEMVVGFSISVLILMTLFTIPPVNFEKAFLKRKLYRPWLEVIFWLPVLMVLYLEFTKRI